MSQPQPSHAGTKLMKVKIYAPFKVYYDGEAETVTAFNRVGPFDVLEGHHNFISLLEPSNMTVRNPGQPDFVMRITRGVIHVKKDEVKVFLDV